jgi:hypothetical protein
VIDSDLVRVEVKVMVEGYCLEEWVLLEEEVGGAGFFSSQSMG